MKAMIFAAGMGTRLQPLTHDTPKALIALAGKPLLQHLIEKLISYGINEIIVNVHHFAQHISEFIAEHDQFGIRIEISDETEMLLDTGGGILKASWFFDAEQPFLVHNVDVLTDMNLNNLVDAHNSSDAIATLAVSKRRSSRYLLFDAGGLLCGWKNLKTGEEIIIHRRRHYEELAFSGIHVLNPGMFGLIRFSGRFSIVKAYLEISKNFPIRCYRHNDSYWLDVGKPENLRKAEQDYPGLNLLSC